MLRLNEINYNFMHELAHKNPKELIKVIKIVEGLDLDQTVSEYLSSMFEDIDCYGNMLTDICF